MTCCIIDDEPHAIKVLVNLIKKIPDLVLLFSDSDPVNALRRLGELSAQPDIIFCDIDMPLFNGLQLANLINKQSQLVFITAHSQYALEAFEKKAVDYLLKPIAPEKFESCIGRCRERKEGKTILIVREESFKSVFINISTVRGNYVNIPFDELIFIKSKGNNLLFHRSNEEEEESYMSFKDLERMMDHHNFKRVHKSYVVNVDFIRAIEFGKIILHNSQTIDLTSGYRKDFISGLGDRVLKNSR